MSLVPFTKFVNDAAGLEKTLRGLQGMTQLAASFFAGYEMIEYLAMSEVIRKHFALGRRYFRFFKFIDCVVASADALQGDENGGPEGVLGALNAVRWQFLGLYILTEAFTILDAMGLRRSSWAPFIFVESMRFWFYSICCTIVLLSVDLYNIRRQIVTLQQRLAVHQASAANSGTCVQATGPTKTKELTITDKKDSPVLKYDEVFLKTKEGLRTAKQQQQLLLQRIVGSFCDLLTPGPVIGAIDVGPAVVASTSILSSVLAGREIWKKVNGR
ncbi:hypothetical protein K490DRAFT_63099 [Saccharata proteae CBS 121410]|uniref:Peroxisomal biogenesis factor 11 n=1 Tax=Saccharata proteae CBS 121410 TaxID=1314787 RepID=A0A9P4I0E0_9PEZI|nr:hypothetical protein K490DRAFT_63099 [Saccharata proteae CBS 121410]